MGPDADELLQERLTLLRRHHPDGYGTTDTTAPDPTEALEVTIDPTDRVRQVRVRKPDLVSTPEALDQAVAGAYREAVSRRRAALRGDRGAERRSGGMPTARSNPLPIATVDNWMEKGWQPDPATVHLHEYSSRDLGPVTGVSENACVTVHLDIASGFGPVTADAAWLSTATDRRIGDAVTQAFTAAYRERDGS